jgi:hypothetical protein
MSNAKNRTYRKYRPAHRTGACVAAVTGLLGAKADNDTITMTVPYQPRR